MPLLNTPLNLLDFIIGALILGSLFMGYKQGLVLSFFRLFTYIIAIVVTKLYHVPFSLLLGRVTPLGTWIDSFFQNHMDGFFTNGLASNTKLAPLLPFGPKFLKLQTLYRDHQMSMDDSMKQYLSTHLSQMTLNLLSIVILFVLCLMTLYILSNALNIAAKLPVINGLNKLGGLVFGFIKVFILISILLFLVVASASLSRSGVVTLQLNNSLLAPYFMRYNMLLIWLGSQLLGV